MFHEVSPVVLWKPAGPLGKILQSPRVNHGGGTFGLAKLDAVAE